MSPAVRELLGIEQVIVQAFMAAFRRLEAAVSMRVRHGNAELVG